jgi:hypothetical protein
MASPACSNETAPLIGAATTSLTEDVYDPAGTTAEGIDLTPYINYKELWEETGVSTKTVWINHDANSDGITDAGGDSGVTTNPLTEKIACNAS